MIPFLQQVARSLISKDLDRFDQICIVVPSQRAHTFLLSFLSQELKRTFIAPKVVTIDEFMSTLSGLKAIDNTQLLLEMFVLNQKINPSGDNDMVKFSGWAQQFLGDINDMDLHLVDAKSLFTTVADIKELALFNTPLEERSARQLAWLEFFKRLWLFYSEFNVSLLNRHSGYQGMIYRYVAEHIHELIPNIGYSKVVFCGFNALTVAEKKVIEVLLREQIAETYWDADEYYLNDSMRDAGQFLRQNFVEFNLKEPNFRARDFAEIPKEIHVVAAQHNMAQAKFVGELFSDPSRFDLDKTVVVPADESLLVPLLYSIPVRKMNITMGLPIAHTQLFSFYTLLFDMQQNAQRVSELQSRNSNKVYVKDLVTILGHAYSRDILAGFNANADEVVSRVQRSKRVFFTLEEIKKLVDDRALDEFLETAFTVWQSASEGLARLRQLLAVFGDKLLSTASQKEIMENPEKLIFSNAYLALSRVLERLSEAAQLFGEVIDVANLRFLFDTEAHKETLSFKGDAKEGLQLMGVLETRTLDFDNVIFLSVNEGVLPSGKTVNSLIPYDVKRYYKLPSYQYKDAVFAYHFFRLLQRASRVYLVYNSGSADGKAERSRFVNQLLLELPKYNPNTRIIHHTLNVEASIDALPPISIAKTTPVLEAIRAIPRYSPSSLSKYINCPLQFYFASVQKIQEPDELLDAVDDATLGNVIHGTLEDIYKPFINAKIDLKPIPPERLNALIYHHFANPNHKVVLNAEDLEFGKNRLVREIAVRYIENVLNADMLASQPVVLRSLEQELSYEFMVVGCPVKLFGKADRIDQLEDGTIRIIDYKTGRVDASKLKVKSIGDLFVKPDLGKAFQLMMYALMYHHDVSNHHSICSGIVSTREKNAPFNPLLMLDSEVVDPELIAGFEERLMQMLREIHDPEVPFRQTEDTKLCGFCTYKAICNR